MKLEKFLKVGFPQSRVSAFSLVGNRILANERESLREELKESRGFLVLKLVGTEDIATTVCLGIGQTFFLASSRAETTYRVSYCEQVVAGEARETRRARGWGSGEEDRSTH